MCITAIVWQLFTEQPLVLLSNRDEFIQRPTAPLHHWQSGYLPIIAGQDLTAGGTWLGINPENGRWGVILNFRQVDANASNYPISRGQIIIDYLTQKVSPLDFARNLALSDYAGFNLVIGDRQQAVMLNNRGFAITVLPSGLYVLSNGQPDQAWYKTERLRGRVRQEILPLIAEYLPWQQAAWNVLADDQTAPAGQLPDTGLAHEAEQALSSIFIPSERMQQCFAKPYGTRVSSIMILTPHGYNILEKNAQTGVIKQFTNT